MSQTVPAIRGMKDLLPGESAIWRTLSRVTESAFASYGYQQISLPIVERTELFKRAVGEVTDIVEKEMYSFEDRKGDSLSLRPEGTAGVVRAAIENGLINGQTERLWYSGPMFRYERPQKGRYRQFHQIGVEAFGPPGPDLDAELIFLGQRIWKNLGLTGITLQLNSLGTAEARQVYRKVLIDYLKQHESLLDEDSKRRLERNPLRVLDSKNPALAEVIEQAPSLVDHLDEESAQHFQQLRNILDAAGVEYVINPRLVRGLDYYSRTVFEWTTTELGAQDAVCSGGRYDDLVPMLGGKPVCAAGWAMGIERITALMQSQQCEIDSMAADVFIVAVGEGSEQQALVLAERLRTEQPQLKFQMNMGGGSFKAQFKRADKSGAAIALILGEDELAAGRVGLKNLRSREDQETVDVDQLAVRLAETVG